MGDNQVDPEQLKIERLGQLLRENKPFEILNLNGGKGSFGCVIIVKDLRDNEEYAIKAISIYDGVGEVCQAKKKIAQEEANFMEKHNHPNIIKQIDSFIIGTTFFIQMEKCECNLEKWIEMYGDEPISLLEFMNFGTQILSAVAHFHSQSYILRDLSLRNILVDKYNKIKLCDFGLIKKINKELLEESFLTTSAKGALLFYPPELYQQMKEKKPIIQDYSGDIWALGICLYALAGASFIDTVNIHANGYSELKLIDRQLNVILQIILIPNPLFRQAASDLQLIFSSFKTEIWNYNNSQILFQQSQLNYSSKQYQKALNKLLLCVEIFSNNQIYQNYLGLTHYQLGRFEDSIKSCQMALQINPKNDTYHKNLGYAYKEKGMLDEAITSCQMALQINPKNDQSHNNLGYAYIKKGMLDEAITSCQMALQINPKNDTYHNNLGKTYQQKGMLDEAITSFQMALHINPQNGEFQQVLDILQCLKI